MKRPKKIWAAGVNLSGIWGPYRMTWDPVCKKWYDSSSDFDVEKMGEFRGAGRITFASEDKAKVKLWLSGAAAFRVIISEWCRG